MSYRVRANPHGPGLPPAWRVYGPYRWWLVAYFRARLFVWWFEWGEAFVEKHTPRVPQRQQGPFR